MSGKSYDVLVLGGGIIGTAIARRIGSAHPRLRVGLVEKESSLGQHTSTRNSSVLHSGIYYATDSFRARFCRDGNAQLMRYIEENRLPLRRTGKYIVATSEAEYERLLELKRQSEINQIEYEFVEPRTARNRERGLQAFDDRFRVIYTPTTAVGDNKAVIASLERDLRALPNVDVLVGHRFRSADTVRRAVTCATAERAQARLEYGYLINAGGLYADQIAKQFGFARKYTILPLKGNYWVSREKQPEISSLVYPVPPIKGSFFLGVHLTCTVDGYLKVGPTAVPALWREQYGNDFSNFSAREFLEIAQQHLRNLLSPKREFYLNHLKDEAKKFEKFYTLNQSRNLTSLYDGLVKPQLNAQFVAGKSGIRSQLLNTETRELVTDFIIENDTRSMHLLNVISPGWTCAFPMADYVLNKLVQEKLLPGERKSGGSDDSSGSGSGGDD